MKIETLQLHPIDPVHACGLAEYARADEIEHAQTLSDAAQAATAYIETAIDRPLSVRTRRATYARFPAENVTLELSEPASDIKLVTYVDAAGEARIMPPTAYKLLETASAAAIAPTGTWPPDATGIGITYTSPPPAQALQAIRLLATYWFEQREAASDRTIHTVPHAVDALILQLRGVLIG